MMLHTYDTTALQAGWDCTYCGRPLGDVHHVNPGAPDGAFCRPECAADHSRREERRRTANPRQIGLAL